MKKIHILCAAAAALVMTTSCEELANIIATNPNFSVTNEVYDGQTQQLQKLGTCKYTWTTDTPTMVTFKDEEEGSKVITYATFKFPAISATCKEVSITAKNAEDETVEAVTNKTTVRPWALHFFKKNGDNWEDINGTNNVTVSEGGDYRAQMVALQNDNTTWKEVTVINYKFSLSGGTENGKLTWTTPSALASSIQLKETYAQFTVSTKTTYTIKADLGGVTRTGTIQYK